LFYFKIRVLRVRIWNVSLFLNELLYNYFLSLILIKRMISDALLSILNPFILP
jgi:hypothetical protein